MTKLDFTQALRQIYLENPCQTLPNPLWKTLAELDGYRTSVEIGRDGAVTRLEAAADDALYLYWTRAARRPSLLLKRRLRTVRRALLHQDYLDPDTVAGFATRLSFFRLIHRHHDLPAAALPPGFRFAAAQPLQANAIADFIARCGDDAPATVEAIHDWGKSPAFYPDGWLWALAGDRPAALGILEVDPNIGEASLEWLQVHPEHRGRGLGRALALELLRRAAARAAFTTVAGRVEDRDNPGGFYRRGGFAGADVWWLLENPFTS